MDLETYLHNKMSEKKQKQKAFGETSLCMDFEMNELQPESSQLKTERRQYSKSPERKSCFLSEVKGSRLMDLFTFERHESSLGKGADMSRRFIRSRFSGKSVEEEENQLFDGELRKNSGEPDQLLQEDLPKEKKEKLTFWVMLQWLGFILMIPSLICSFGDAYLSNLNLCKIKLRQLTVLASSLIGGSLISEWVFGIFLFFIKRNFLLRKRVAYFLLGLRKKICYFLWMGFVLIVWQNFFGKNDLGKDQKRVLRIGTRVLVSLQLSLILWIGKTLSIKLLSSYFYMRTYFDKIQYSMSDQYIIKALSGPPLTKIRQLEEEERAKELRSRHTQVGFIRKIAQKLSIKVILSKCGIFLGSHDGKTSHPPVMASPYLPSTNRRVIGSGRLEKIPRDGTPISSHLPTERGEKEYQGISIDLLQILNPESVSTWNFKRMMHIIRNGSLSTWDDSIRMKTENDAKRLAEMLFHNVAEPGSRVINLKDIARFMEKEEALKTIGLFKGEDDSQSITKSTVKIWLGKAFREWRELAFTLDDVKAIINRIHKGINVFAGIIILLMSLFILEMATAQFLQNSITLVAAIFLGLTFIFGDVLKAIFEAIIFIFVTNAFSVTDCCEIEDDRMTVERINLLSTVFKRYDGTETTISNKVLSTATINNKSCNPDMGDDVIKFYVNKATLGKIATTKERISSYVENKNGHWHPKPEFKCKVLKGLTWVKLKVLLKHIMNHQYMKERRKRRDLMKDEIAKILRELDIKICWDLPTHMPNVTSDRAPPNCTVRIYN